MAEAGKSIAAGDELLMEAEETPLGWSAGMHPLAV
jgi:hypothetical protein